MTNIIRPNWPRSKPEHEGLWPRTYNPTGMAAYGEPFTPPPEERSRWRKAVLFIFGCSAFLWIAVLYVYGWLIVMAS